MDTNPKPLT